MMPLPFWFAWFWEWVFSSYSVMWIWIGVGTILEIGLSYYGITPRFIKLKSRRRTWLVSGLVFYGVLNIVVNLVAAVVMLGQADI